MPKSEAFAQKKNQNCLVVQQHLQTTGSLSPLPRMYQIRPNPRPCGDISSRNLAASLPMNIFIVNLAAAVQGSTATASIHPRFAVRIALDPRRPDAIQRHRPAPSDLRSALGSVRRLTRCRPSCTEEEKQRVDETNLTDFCITRSSQLL